MIPHYPSSESVVSPLQPPMSPASATRKYYKGRKGPMLREHTSLTFTQKYYRRPPKFPLAIEIFCKTPHRLKRPQSNGRDVAAVSVGVDFCGERCKLSPSSASVKMALANDWKTARRNGSG